MTRYLDMMIEVKSKKASRPELYVGNCQLAVVPYGSFPDVAIHDTLTRYGFKGIEISPVYGSAKCKKGRWRVGIRAYSVRVSLEKIAVQCLTHRCGKGQHYHHTLLAGALTLVGGTFECPGHGVAILEHWQAVYPGLAALISMACGHILDGNLPAKTNVMQAVTLDGKGQLSEPISFGLRDLMPANHPQPKAPRGKTRQ